MVAPGFLQNDRVKAWLGGIEPAWTLLDIDSFNALAFPRSPTEGPIHMATDLSIEEINQSAIARNTIILLRAASIEPGLQLTATGNLSRAVVAAMLDAFTWPAFDKADVLRHNKVVNEPDVLPLFFVRHLVMASKLLRRHKGYLRMTPLGRKMLLPQGLPSLQAILFDRTFRGLDLSYLCRGLHGDWPQRDAGRVLWSLSAAANEWETPERLTRLCTIPVNGVLDSTWDSGSSAMEARILRTLLWFGLLEARDADGGGPAYARRHLYRKTTLFDRFLSFDVRLEASDGSRH